MTEKSNSHFAASGGQQVQVQAVKGAPLDSYSPEDRAFYRFWYGHMRDDLMQPPLAGISHSTARYIWDAVADAKLRKELSAKYDALRAELPE